MKEKTFTEFISKGSVSPDSRFPESGLFELTYRCNLECIHCYCKGSEYLEKELTTNEVKDILNQVHKEGCLDITFSGGEPLIREDFLDIYLYAYKKGFIINIFTNGLLLTEDKIKFLQKYPPCSIEITLNGITKDTYEAITQIKGSFNRAIFNIKELARRNMPLVIKANCLKQNKEEISKIKAFTKEALGRDKKRFKFDTHIYPRLNGDLSPCRYRLTPFELEEVMESDSEISIEYEERLRAKQSLLRDRDFLYQCDTWLNQFFISPSGRLKFCQLTEKFSTDLRKRLFKEGFYDVFPQLSKEKFRRNSKCRNCESRTFCSLCPAKAYLETRNEQAPVSYFCELADTRAESKKQLLSR